MRVDNIFMQLYSVFEGNGNDEMNQGKLNTHNRIRIN